MTEWRASEKSPGEMRQLQEQKNEALRMKLRKEVDTKTFREVTAEIDAAHDQLAREHRRPASEAAMPELRSRRALRHGLDASVTVPPWWSSCWFQARG